MANTEHFYNVVYKHSGTGAEIKAGPYTPAELLTKMEDDCYDEATQCDCKPVGEILYAECNCGEKFVNYVLDRVELCEDNAAIVPAGPNEKKLVYLFSDGMDYKNIALEEISAIDEWIKADAEMMDDEELKELEYTIRLTRMTQTEIDNLPEAE